jgi:hypothetical protein
MVGGKCECGYEVIESTDSGNIDNSDLVSCKSEIGSTLAVTLIPAVLMIFKKRRK